MGSEDRRLVSKEPPRSSQLRKPADAVRVIPAEAVTNIS
jgi:hypothetical protein